MKMKRTKNGGLSCSEPTIFKKLEQYEPGKSVQFKLSQVALPSEINSLNATEFYDFVPGEDFQRRRILI